MRLTAEQIYDKLIREDEILSLNGQIKFYLGDVNIIVKQRDVVGNIMQEWLQGWLDARGIEYAPSENTQMPPDFYLNPDDKTVNLLEVKAFNYSGSPGFDIADFRMYAQEIQEKPYMLDVDYLIFGYDMDVETGTVTIKKVWLKKVWQITRRMEDHALNLQVKDGVIHKIRPGVWYSDHAVDYSIFESLEDFISAVDDTVYREPRLRDTIATTWLSKFQRNYRNRYGKELNVPRWSEIKDKYDVVSVRRFEKAMLELQKVEQKIEKEEARAARYREAVDVAKTEKQLQKAEENLSKAEISLEKAIEKRNAMKTKVEMYNIRMK